MKGKHAQKNFSAVGAMAPTPLSLKTRAGGVSHTRTGLGRPPLWVPLLRTHSCPTCLPPPPPFAQAPAQFRAP